ncbi:MAG: ABC transporter ATP-binding protein [Ignavibacteriae bacterium]|nr:ABC transporter ATP-binding protein [Ignavibacteriota bacterium]
MTVVHTEQLSKTYRSGIVRRSEVNALRNVSLEVGSGEIFGLLGPNGAGKTTFVKILLNVSFPTLGSATILNEPLGSINIRKRSGYLPENHRYPNFLTGLETLMMFGRIHGLDPRTLKDKAVSLLQTVGLKDWAHHKIKKYSKGMLQRLGLAQALLNDPEILFLDEPTDGVDPVGRKEIRDLLRDLRNQGKTIFLNSHILSEVELISDRVAILNKGEVIKVGTVDSITRKEDEYEFHLADDVSSDVLSQIKQVYGQVEQDGKLLRVIAQSSEQMNKVIDFLRSKNILIQSIVHRKSTLEESFIELIKAEQA